MSEKTSQLWAGKVKSGVYRFSSHTSTDSLCAEASKAGWLCYHIDGATVKDKAAFLSAVATSLHFPAYFSHNWDALEECLRDLSWEHPEQAKGILILYHDVDRFAKAHLQDWAVALDILKSAMTFWRKSRRPMIVLLRGDASSASDAPEF